MWRPRFLTIMAVSVIVEPFADAVAKDETTPPWLIFEGIISRLLRVCLKKKAADSECPEF
jgi:hypothetical protein